jgi:Sigma-70 region 2
VWRYREDVWRLASQLCQHREDAEDVTQSALLKAAEHLDGFRWEASLRTWLHRIATNECRMLRRRKAPLSLDELLEQAATAPQRPGEPPAREPGPEEAAVEAETAVLWSPRWRACRTGTGRLCCSRTASGCLLNASPSAAVGWVPGAAEGSAPPPCSPARARLSGRSSAASACPGPVR